MAETKDVVVAIILNKNKEILLQKKDQGYAWFPGKWCLFGGQIEEGEKSEEAIIRELQEEIGCRINTLRFNKTLRFASDYTKEKLKVNFNIYSGLFEGKISDISLGEGAGFAFFSPSELNSLNLEENHKTIIKDNLKDLS